MNNQTPYPYAIHTELDLLSALSHFGKQYLNAESVRNFKAKIHHIETTRAGGVCYFIDSAKSAHAPRWYYATSIDLTSGQLIRHDDAQLRGYDTLDQARSALIAVKYPFGDYQMMSGTGRKWVDTKGYFVGEFVLIPVEGSPKGFYSVTHKAGGGQVGTIRLNTKEKFRKCLELMDHFQMKHTQEDLVNMVHGVKALNLTVNFWYTTVSPIGREIAPELFRVLSPYDFKHTQHTPAHAG